MIRLTHETRLLHYRVDQPYHLISKDRMHFAVKENREYILH